jgi:hypothetical protein
MLKVILDKLPILVGKNLLVWGEVGQRKALTIIAAEKKFNLGLGCIESC